MRTLLLAMLLSLNLIGCGRSFRAVQPGKALLPSLPRPEQGDDSLLSATFDRSAPELRFASSRNGMTWSKVQNGKAFFVDHATMRDPSVVRGPDGTYHCVYTTASTNSIGYTSSRDLVDWSPPRWLPVMQHEPRTRVCWAPELFWDRSRQEWLLVWSSDVAGEFRVDHDTERFIHRLYACTTKDFITLSKPWLYFDPGYNVIDPDLVEFRGQVVLFYKDERLNPDRKVLMLATASDPRGPFCDPRPTLPLAPVEGPSALPLGDGLIVYFDAYIDNAMGAMRTTDLVAWENISKQTWFPPGHRHGSVLRVSRETFDRVVSPAGSSETSSSSLVKPLPQSDSILRGKPTKTAPTGSTAGAFLPCVPLTPGGQGPGLPDRG